VVESGNTPYGYLTFFGFLHPVNAISMINMLETNAKDNFADDFFIASRLTYNINVKILIISIK
jgi:hypothetical protein